MWVRKLRYNIQWDGVVAIGLHRQATAQPNPADRRKKQNVCSRLLLRYLLQISNLAHFLKYLETFKQ